MTTPETTNSPNGWTANKADEVARTIKNFRPEWDAYLEYEDSVSVHHPQAMGFDIWFGNANKPFGASIYTGVENEHDAGYLETGLDANHESAERLAAAAVEAIEQWNLSRKGQSNESTR